ncbi:MAG: AbgT family transporter [Clostridium sp.]
MKTLEKKKKSLFSKFLDFVEKTGNAMPHPVTIFFMFCLAIIVISGICAKLGVTVNYEGIDTKTLEKTQMTVSAVSLMSADGIRYMLTSAVKNFTSFAPLGTVLVAMLGVGVAEGTGLISASIRKLVLSTPKSLITAVVVFAGVMSNVASDAGYIVLVPLGAVIFLSFKRHPLAGIAAAFAGVSGGFSANLMIGTIDPLLGGISTEAARIWDATYTVAPTANLFFMIASTVLITVLGTIVTEKIVEPRLGKYKGDDSVDVEGITNEEQKGLRYALIALIVLVAIILVMTVPSWGILRHPKTGDLLKSPFMDGMVPIILLAFLVPAIAYGIGSGSVKSDKSIVKAMSKSMASMGGYIVLVFVASQFVAYFSHTNLGTILAVKGADFLKNTGINGIPLIIGFVLLAGFINLFMGSASAKWAILAPIFIPMLMQLGFSPELTQVAYRIGDSTTNIISPLMSYFALIVTFAEKYDKESGIGTLISTMVPYTVVFLIGWIVMLVIWYMIGLPLGPGVPLHYPM